MKSTSRFPTNFFDSPASPKFYKESKEDKEVRRRRRRERKAHKKLTPWEGWEFEFNSSPNPPEKHQSPQSISKRVSFEFETHESKETEKTCKKSRVRWRQHNGKLDTQVWEFQSDQDIEENQSFEDSEESCVEYDSPQQKEKWDYL